MATCSGTTKSGQCCKFKVKSPCGTHCYVHCSCFTIECSICYKENVTKITKFPCGHEFCKICAGIWRKDHSTCPMCRASIRGTSRPPPVPVQDTVEPDIPRELIEEDLLVRQMYQELILVNMYS